MSSWKLLGIGNSSRVYRRQGVYRLVTSDPVAVQAWLGMLTMQNAGVASPGPKILKVVLGNRVAVIDRTGAKPLKADGIDYPWHTDAAMYEQQRHYGYSAPSRQQLRKLRAASPLAPLVQLQERLRTHYGTLPLAYIPGSVGVARGNRLRVVDPGGSNVQALGRKLAGYPCPAIHMRAQEVQALVKSAPNFTSCSVVSSSHMTRILQDHGWSRGEAASTSGFFSPSGDISLLEADTSTLWHELLHGTGITSTVVCVWLAESLVTLLSMDLARQHKVHFTPTYRAWAGLCQGTLMPMLGGMTQVDLAQLIIKEQDKAPKVLGRILASNVGGKPSEWERALRPGVSSSEPFTRLCRKYRW